LEGTKPLVKEEEKRTKEGVWVELLAHNSRKGGRRGQKKTTNNWRLVKYSLPREKTGIDKKKKVRRIRICGRACEPKSTDRKQKLLGGNFWGLKVLARERKKNRGSTEKSGRWVASG